MIVFSTGKKQTTLMLQDFLEILGIKIEVRHGTLGISSTPTTLL
jgi:hypothetical protein